MHKTRAELKSEAKNALKGRWKESILLNLVPSLLSIVPIIAVVFLSMFFLPGSGGSASGTYVDGATTTVTMDALGGNSGSYTVGQGIWGLIVSFLSIGISFTFLDVLRNPERKISPVKDAFRVFNGKDFVPLLLIQILGSLFTWFWSLLFIIPGVIKAYAYSQSKFIYKDMSGSQEQVEAQATTYITESRLLMDGHKVRLFVLDLSFIGWYILCLATFGLGFIVLNPYVNATKAAFYNDLTKDRHAKEQQDRAEWHDF